MAALTAFDVVVLLLVALAAIAGLMRGFIGEIVSLIAWVAGIAAVRLFYTPAKTLATGLTGTEAGGAILALVGLFLGGFLAVRIAGGRLSAGARASIIGPLDRALGLGFGAAKGVLGAALLFLLLNLVFDTIDPGEPGPDWLAGARTAPTLAMVSKAMVDFVEERRRVPHDVAEADGDTAGNAPGEDGTGYDAQQRGALDRLLDDEEKARPSTPI